MLFAIQIPQGDKFNENERGRFIVCNPFLNQWHNCRAIEKVIISPQSNNVSTFLTCIHSRQIVYVSLLDVSFFKINIQTSKVSLEISFIWGLRENTSFAYTCRDLTLINIYYYSPAKFTWINVPRCSVLDKKSQQVIRLMLISSRFVCAWAMGKFSTRT